MEAKLNYVSNLEFPTRNSLCILGINLSARIIKPCSRNLQNINSCIIDSINMLRPNLISGNLGEGVEIPKLDPLIIDEIKITNGNDLQANFKNLSVFGPSNFKVLNLEYDHFDFHHK